MTEDALLNDLLLTWEDSYRQGREISAEDLCLDRLELLPELRKRIAALRAVEGVLQHDALPAPESPTPVENAAPQVDPLLRACLAAPQQPDELGRLGPYRVLKLLGAGGMGAVLLAEDPLLRRQVALKIMLPRLDPDEQVRERFLREAQLAAQLKHEHIVTIHHVGEECGVPYLSMELLQGENLEVRLKREGKLTLTATVRIGREIALGLAAAHANGVIHRDIKPANIWLEAPQGHVKLLDFGLARPVAAADKLTHSGYIVGTPSYMAPEQATGETVDARADLFSLGCVLYRLTTGEAPFAGKDSVAILLAAARQPPVPVRSRNAEVPTGLATLIERLLAKEPARRPASAQAVADVLEQLQRQTEERTDQIALLPQRGRRDGWITAAAGSLVLACVALLAISSSTEETPSTEVTTTARQAMGTAAGSREQPKKPQPVAPALPPLNAEVLVQRPPPLPGLRSWTLEVDRFRAGNNRIHVSASPTQPLVATSSADGAIRIWHTETGKLARCFISPEALIEGLTWSPDGRWLASRPAVGTLRIWEASTGKVLRELPVPDDFLRPSHGFVQSNMTWAPSGTQIVNAVRDFRPFEQGGGWHVTLVDIHTGRPVWTQRHASIAQGSVHLSWSKDGRSLALSVGNTVTVLDAADGKLLQQQPPLGGTIGGVAFAPDSRRLAIACYRPDLVVLWDVEQNRELRRIDNVSAKLSWSPDGRYLAANTKVLETTAWQTVATLTNTGNSNNSLLFCKHTWSADSTILTFSASDGFFGKLTLPDGRQVAWTPPFARLEQQAPLWSPDGRWLAGLGILWLYDARSGSAFRHFGRPISAAGFWQHDSQAFVLGMPPSVKIWKLPPAAPGHAVPPVRLAPLESGGALAVAPDGKRYAYWGRGADKIAIRYADSHTVEQVLPLETAVDKVYRPQLYAWAKSDVLVVHVEPGGRLLRWQLPQGTRLPDLTLKPPPHSHREMALSPDGLLLVVSDKAQTRGVTGSQGYLLDMATEQRRLLAAQADHAAWSPCGRWIAVVDYTQDGPMLRLFEAASARQLHANRVVSRRGIYGLSWSPTADVVAITSSGSLEFWNPLRQELLGQFICLEDQHGVFVSADGHYRGTPGIEEHLRYVIQTEAGQETLTPAEFTHRFGWRNDPMRVRLCGE